MLVKSNPERRARSCCELAQEDVDSRWKLYDYMAHAAGQRREEVKK